MFHHTRDAIEAHLTIVFYRPGRHREAQNRTGLAIRNLVRPRPLRSDHRDQRTQQTFPPAITTHQRKILDALNPTRHAINQLSQLRRRTPLPSAGLLGGFLTAKARLTMFFETRMR